MAVFLPKLHPHPTPTPKGCTALHYACIQGHLAVAGVLLTHPSFTAQDAQDWNGWTALHAAAAHGRKALDGAGAGMDGDGWGWRYALW